MSRKETTWFGIKLNRKHATQVFILSFAGFFILTLIIIPMLSSFLMSLRSATFSHSIDSWIQYSMMNMLPYLCVLFAFLIVTMYSLLRSRRVVQSYSDIIKPQKTELKRLKFCPNCGNERKAIEKFCRICGAEFK